MNKKLDIQRFAIGVPDEGYRSTVYLRLNWNTTPPENPITIQLIVDNEVYGEAEFSSSSNLTVFPSGAFDTTPWGGDVTNGFTVNGWANEILATVVHDTSIQNKVISFNIVNGGTIDSFTIDGAQGSNMNGTEDLYVTAYARVTPSEAVKQQMFIKFNEGFSADSENKVFTSNVSSGTANITLGSDSLADVENVYLFYTFYCTEISKDTVSINIYDSSIEGTDGELVNEPISMSSDRFYKMGKIYIGTLTGDTNIDVTFYKTSPMGGSGWFKFYLGQGTIFDTIEAAGFRGYEKGAYEEGNPCLADGVVITYNLDGSFTTSSSGWTRKEDILHGVGTPVTYFTKRFTSNSNETLDILYNGETVQLPVSIYEMNSNTNVIEGADQIYYGTTFINGYTLDSVEWKYHANEGYKIENVPILTSQDLQNYGYDSSYEFKGWDTSFATDNMTVEDIATVVLFPEYISALNLSMSAWIEKKTIISNTAVNGIRLNGQQPSSVYIGNQEIIKIIYNGKVIYNKGEGLPGHTYADLASMTHEQLAQYTHAELAGE